MEKEKRPEEPLDDAAYMIILYRRREGLFKRKDGVWCVDRRYTQEYVAGSPILTPRTADLNLIGPDIVPISDNMMFELGLE